jgi:hypothetical protein
MKKRAAPNSNRKCVVLVPTMDNLEPGCEDGLRALEGMGYSVWRRYGVSDITMGRNGLANEALAAGFSELMWIDSDILFNPQDVQRLRRHRLPVVGGIYPKKGDRTMACVLLPGNHEILFGEGGGLLEVKYLATGFLLTRKEVYESMLRKRHSLGLGRTGGVPFFYHIIGRTGRQLSEDYSFCARVARCGYRVMADTAVRLGHIGRYVYSWEDVGGLRERQSACKVRVVGEPAPGSKIVLPPNIICRERLQAPSIVRHSHGVGTEFAVGAECRQRTGRQNQ